MTRALCFLVIKFILPSRKIYLNEINTKIKYKTSRIRIISCIFKNEFCSFVIWVIWSDGISKVGFQKRKKLLQSGRESRTAQGIQLRSMLATLVPLFAVNKSRFISFILKWPKLNRDKLLTVAYCNACKRVRHLYKYCKSLLLCKTSLK